MSTDYISSHDVALRSIQVHTGFRNTYIDQHGICVIHRAMNMRTRTDEVGDTINESTYIAAEAKIVVDLTEYYTVLAAYKDATSENHMRLRVLIRTDSRMAPGDRVLFTHQLYPAILEDKEWYVADVRGQAHAIVVSKYALLTPLRDV